METLEVGMYVRTKHYGIFKILNIEKQNKIIFLKKAQGIDCVVADKYNPIEKEVIKASHNIIDLIEVGDVVVDNSGRKLEVNLIRVWNDVKEIICNDYNLDDSAITLHNGGIFKVLTKEQFENNCYKIGD